MLFKKQIDIDKTGFEEQLLACMDSMYNLAYRMSRHHEEACDIVQEASIKAFRFYHKFEQGTNFKGWVLTIVRNTFINDYRKRRREPVKVSYDEIEGFISGPDMTGVQEEIFGESLQAAIDDLSEEMRTVLILFYVEDLSYKDIAGIMTCPVGTVMSRLHQARQLLKKKLNRMSGANHKY